MKLSIESRRMVLFFCYLVSRATPSAAAASTRNICPPALREVPQLPDHAENFPNLRLPSDQGPLLMQQPFIAPTFSRGNEILMVCDLIVNPSASIVVSQSVLFLGAKIGVAPTSPRPNNHT